MKLWIVAISDSRLWSNWQFTAVCSEATGVTEASQLAQHATALCTELGCSVCLSQWIAELAAVCYVWYYTHPSTSVHGGLLAMLHLTVDGGRQHVQQCQVCQVLSTTDGCMFMAHMWTCNGQFFYEFRFWKKSANEALCQKTSWIHLNIFAQYRCVADIQTCRFVVNISYKQVCNKSTTNRTDGAWALVYSIIGVYLHRCKRHRSYREHQQHCWPYLTACKHGPHEPNHAPLGGDISSLWQDLINPVYKIWHF